MTRQLHLFGRSAALPAALAADFAAFWAAYPPRAPNPRAVAEAAYVGAIRAGATPADLVAAAAGYAAECRRLGTAEAFIVHARTFLGQARWRDYVPAADAPPAPVAPAAVDPAHPLACLLPLLGESVWRIWIAPVEVASWAEGDRALLVAPDPFHRDRLRQQHAPALRAALRVRRLDILAREEMGE